MRARNLLLFVSVAWCCIALAARSYAQAGPPLLTDDPDTPGNNHWEINMAMTLSQTKDKRLFGAPLLDVNYGLGEHIQLKGEIPWLLAQDRFGAPHESGFGSINVGAKWRFFDQEKHGVAMSIYPQLEFRPFSSSVRKHLVESGAELRLPVEISREFGKFAVIAEIGFQAVQREKDEWIYGFALAQRLNKHMELVGEFHGESKRDLTENEIVFNFGCRYKLNKRYTLLFSSGRTLGRASGDRPTWIAYSGWQFHF